MIYNMPANTIKIPVFTDEKREYEYFGAKKVEGQLLSDGKTLYVPYDSDICYVAIDLDELRQWLQNKDATLSNDAR